MTNILTLFILHSSFALILIGKENYSKSIWSSISILSEENTTRKALIPWEKNSNILWFNLERKSSKFQSNYILLLKFLSWWNQWRLLSMSSSRLNKHGIWWRRRRLTISSICLHQRRVLIMSNLFRVIWRMSRLHLLLMSPFLVSKGSSSVVVFLRAFRYY